MKAISRILFISGIVFFLGIYFSADSFAQQQPRGTKAGRGFVDLNGDGINDNALDSDGDGIVTNVVNNFSDSNFLSELQKVLRVHVNNYCTSFICAGNSYGKPLAFGIMRAF